jgi:FkbM family methyltransferase
MTLFEFMLKVTNRVPFLKKMMQSSCRYAVTHSSTRARLNKFYNRLNQKERIIFHYMFARIFRNRKVPTLNAEWIVQFNNTRIRMPLRSETLWLDWDLAVSIMGHDLEIKHFYEKFIESQKPLYFLDVGANYGTHSLLFLSQGVNAITFEPNPECVPIFQSLLAANDLRGQVEKYAIGEKNSFAELVFPKGDTWNGSLDSGYQHAMESSDLVRIKVDIVSLDNWVEQRRIKPNIIKIDTEGFELNVLRGARKTISESKAAIVFETNKGQERSDLFNEFKFLGYDVFGLRNAFNSPRRFTQEEFVNSHETNFLALSTNGKMKLS